MTWANRVAFLFLLVIVGAGCGEKGPLLAHGKPVDHWLQEIKSPDLKSRKKAVIALGHVGTADSRAIPALIAAVKDRDATIRKEAVLALLNIGPAAQDALAVLREAEKDQDATVRLSARKAIARILASRAPPG
jgi:HEAT repeat protein